MSLNVPRVMLAGVMVALCGSAASAQLIVGTFSRSTMGVAIRALSPMAGPAISTTSCRTSSI